MPDIFLPSSVWSQSVFILWQNCETKTSIVVIQTSSISMLILVPKKFNFKIKSQFRKTIIVSLLYMHNILNDIWIH